MPLPTPEEETVHDYVLAMTYLLMAVTGLGYLALMWSTVVLLGGFVSSLQKKDFWCLAVISMMQAARIFNDLADHQLPNFVNIVETFIREDTAQGLEEIRITSETFRQTPILSAARSTWWRVALILFVVVIYVPFLGVCYIVVFLYGYGPISCIALALWRLGQRNYGTTDGDAGKANLVPALDIFYCLVLIQGIFYLIWSCADIRLLFEVIGLRRACKLPRKGWTCTALAEYLLDIRARCWRDPASIRGRKLVDFAVDLLDSESSEDILLGERMLHAFISRGADVSSLLLPSWHKIQKLIDTLGGKRGPECAREMRELAAYIVVHLAGDIHLAQFPGAIQCISSLLQSETTWMYWNSNQQGLPHPQSEPPPKKQAMILRLQKVEQKKEAWRHGQVMKKHDGDHRMEEVDNSSGNGGGGGGSNKLILLGLSILKRLASDHQNCNEICSTPGILPKITAPLYSDTLVQDIRISAWADVVNETFQVLVRLVRDPGESSKRLVQDISSNKHAVSNLEKILDENSIAGPGMQMRAMNILTALASDSSSNLARETKENLMKKQLQTFLADEGVEELEATCNPNKATAGGALAFLSTNSETNSAFIMSGYDDILGRLTDKLDPKNNNIYRIIAADILGNLCAHCALDKERVKETLLPKVLTEILSTTREPPQSENSAPGNDEENQKNSAPELDEENQHYISTQGVNKEDQEISLSGDQNKSSDNSNKEQTATKELQEAFLSLTLVIYDKLISADDFDNVVQKKALGHGAFVAKLKTIVKENSQATIASLRIVKLCGQIAVSMMLRNQYTAHFKDQEFVKALSEALKVMSNLESCMLFTGTDFGPKNTVRPLLSDIEEEAHELLAS